MSKESSKYNYKKILLPPSNINTLEFAIFGICSLIGIVPIIIICSFSKFSLFLIIKIVISLVVVFFLASIFSYFVVKPIKEIVASIEDYAKNENKDVRIDSKSYLEFNKMINSINSIIEDINAMDESRSEFVSNVSHELKTPITSMKVLADSLIMQEGAVPIEVYEDFMKDIAREVERESEIITDLLTLVKLDQKAAELEIENRSINDLLDLIMKRIGPIAAERGIQISLETFKEVRADIDETKLTLAISNLVENAVKYNKDGGWIHVSLNSDDKYFYIKIKDSGEGISEDKISHIFERFYRADKSRSQKVSGTGLGLAITRSAIVMHRGSIKVANNIGPGTIFAVRIPLTYAL